MGYRQRVDVNSLLGINGKGVLVYGVDAIDNSIYNILGCLLGTRGYHPTYGCLLARYLWEPVHPGNAQRIKIALVQAIENWEPDVLLDLSRTSVVPMPAGDGYDITVSYLLREDNTPHTARWSFDRGNR